MLGDKLSKSFIKIYMYNKKYSFKFTTNTFINYRWEVCSSCSLGRLGARYDGLCEIWTFWSDLQTLQLCVWSEWSWQQLGQRSLHRGRRTNWFCFGCRTQGVGELWLSAGIPTYTLTRWRYWIRYGHSAHPQDPRRIPKQNLAYVLHCPFPKGLYSAGEFITILWV